MDINMKIYAKSISKVIGVTLLFSLTSISVKAETVVMGSPTIPTQVTKIAQASVNAVIAMSDAIDKKDLEIDDKSFSCIRDMTPVRHFYVDNLLGDIESTIAVANNPEDTKYPEGSVVQLVPTEVMVKREAGTFPATGDWEFFELEVNDKGSKIAKRGFVDVNNRFGGNCFTCHAPAREKWDFICESGHGCEPIPIDHSMTGALQRSDPRCGEPELESGDSMALFKLKAMVTIGRAKKWIEDKL